MSFESLKRKFYKYYDKYRDFIVRLQENSSNALTIIGGSHILLDGFFMHLDDEDFPEDVYEYLIDDDNLESCAEFFIKRIEILAELDEIYDEDDFEELIPVLYYKCCFEELLETFYSELEDNEFIDTINDKIKFLECLLDKGEYFKDDEEEDISLVLETVSRGLDETKMLSMVIFAVYCMYIEKEDDLEEECDDEIELGDINLQISTIIGHAVNEVNKKLLSMKKSNILYKEILKYKQLIDKCLYLTEIEDLDYNMLCEKLGFDFRSYSSLLMIFYLEALRLLKDDYKFLKINDNDFDKMNKLTKYIQLASVLYYSNAFISENDMLEQLNNSNYIMLQQISKNEISLDEIENILYNVTFEFFNYLELEFESVDEFLNCISEKLSHACNEYYI
ncbi:MAG: hypothetical protein E7183_04300 [Erysipelotrichaceae bacterium]|nr:hypothetical protein [Erysipelotrichaceae bacterium]